MKTKSLTLAFAAVAAMALASAAHAANTVNVTYFSVQETGADFGICCSSPPATLPTIALGSALLGGMPVTAPGTVADVDANNRILWWTPTSTGTPNITQTGAAVLNLPFADNAMFAPNSTGPDNSAAFETAILSGNVVSLGGPATFTISADDDALVYLNGLYIGGTPGVHGVTTANLNLNLNPGNNTLEVFYADRAQTGAELDFGISGATITAAAPEPTTWALMLLGIGGLGAAMRMSRRKSDDAALALA